VLFSINITSEGTYQMTTGLMQRSEACFTHKQNEYITPKALYDKLNRKYKFTLDPCTTPENPLGTPIFYTEKDNGVQSWKDERVYCNPPYYNRTIHQWLEKARTSEAEMVVMLLKSKTDTKAFHQYLYKKKGVKITFLKGRLRFEGKYGKKNSAPFPSLIAVFKPEKKDQATMFEK
jgi:hypothetical protein